MFEFEKVEKKDVYFVLTKQENRDKLNEIIPLDCLQRVVTFGYALGYPDALMWKGLSVRTAMVIKDRLDIIRMKENSREIWLVDF